MTTLEPRADCPLDGDLAFTSMGDIRRATARFREDPDNPITRDILNSYRKFRLNCFQTSLLMLKKSRLPDKVLVSARLKRLTSIKRKLSRSQVLAPLNEMDDIIGFRVICESLEDAVGLGERIENSLAANIKDYTSQEHVHGVGYRAIHAIARFNQPLQDKVVKVRFEIQVRTWYQHLWACWCESHGEQAKEGYPNARHGDGTYDKKRKLRDWSDRLRGWENLHPDHVQEILPGFSDPYNLAIAWSNSLKDYSFDLFRNDVSGAVSHLNYLETLVDTEPLLLVGVAEDRDLEELLRRTHPNFMSSRSLDPQYWMPMQG